MVRTVISLDPEDKAWLDGRARETGKTMTSVVRDAVNLYRSQEAKRRSPPLKTVLERTRGMWKHGDGLAWQKKMRSEWDKRHCFSTRWCLSIT